MKKLFKILAVLISFVMILSIFAGCNGTTGDGAGDGAGSGDGSTPDTDGGKDDTPGGDKTDPDGGEVDTRPEDDEGKKPDDEGDKKPEDEGENEEKCQHEFTEWTVIGGKYCHNRIYESECNLCGNTTMKKGSEEDHVWITTKVEPTCQKEGYTATECEKCGKKEDTKTIPTVDHKAGGKTEVGDLSHWYLCVFCDAPIIEEEHKFDDDGICEVCGAEQIVDTQKTYDVTIWVSSVYGVAEQMKKRIEEFEATFGVDLNVSIEGVYEADIASSVLYDVATAPDIYTFSQDSLIRLVGAGALAPLGSDASDRVTAANNPASLLAATVGDQLYAYPMSTDNGYFLYYDTSIISPEEADSLEAIITACEREGLTFRYGLENAWYTASFFFATGCTSQWITDENGNFVDLYDTFCSEAGLIAMKGMQKLAQSPCYDSNNDDFTNAGAIVSGSWNLYAAYEHFGENLGVTDLPSFTVDGTSYHLGSYSGHKLMGVKPQADAERAAMLHLLAEWLTNEQSQAEMLEVTEYLLPSNINVQASEEFMSNPANAAIALQTNYSVPQGNIHGGWWDIAKDLGSEAKRAYSENDLVLALENYNERVSALIQNSNLPDRWSLIGNICGTQWDTDFYLIDLGNELWQSELIYLNAGEEFKVRKNESWEYNYGYGGELEGNNIVVSESGYYIILIYPESEDYCQISMHLQQH